MMAMRMNVPMPLNQKHPAPALTVVDLGGGPWVQKGYVTYQEFLARMGIEYLPSIHRPYTVDHFNFMGHFTKQDQMQEEAKEMQQALEMSKPFREKFKDHLQDLSQTFAKLDKHRNSFISMSDLQKVLQEYHPNITEEEIVMMLKRASQGPTGMMKEEPQFSPCPWSSGAELCPWGPSLVKDFYPLQSDTHEGSQCQEEWQQAISALGGSSVLKGWGITCSDNIVYYHEFLRALESFKPSKSHSREREENMQIPFSPLTPEQALKRMKDLVLANHNTFYKTAAEWTEKMQKVSVPKAQKDPFLKELLLRVRDIVTTRFSNLLQEFTDMDCSRSCTTSKEEFRNICNRHFQILNDEQFETFWNELPLNSEGRLKYQEFLCKFNMEKSLSPPATADPTKSQRPSTTPEVEAGMAPVAGPAPVPGSAPRPQTGAENVPGTASSTGSKTGVPPLQNCEAIENRLRKKIQGFWKEMLKECKEKDVDKQGEISVPEFQALVDKYNLDLSKEDCQNLITKYDLKNNGKFAYCDFFQSCILLLKPKENSLMQRMKIQQVYMMKGAGTQSPSFYAALLRIQPKILHCWRPMRRTFKSYDESGTGLLSIDDFRKVLRQYGINLSEEEFFHILEYYDKTLSSKISYNDFLRAFLQ
ncbi:EF-hand calcium-binding domain-containing protein 6 [Gracilinanus agilis]|uniref:EF-hand calcium-binding domain-containing protein 6 n=1 Tax=Gracilinanus agilis TaxID=191870 RepID=UPI001CFDD086|nr:EF-hand calcium-binding domain-containing protein 6 [Gracilinanus agilis]